MKNKTKMIVMILRISIGILFTLAGIVKMSNLVLFEETIELFNVFPQYSKLFSIIIPSIEVVAGIFLILGIFRKAAIVVLIPLVFSFTFAIWVNLRGGFIFDCGCFGPLNILSRISTEKILFNFVLIGGLLLAFIKETEKVNLINHIKILMTYAVFIAILVYIPYSNTSWSYTINKKNIKKIEWKTAYNLIKNNQAILFDARTIERYKKKHVPGALLLPVLDFDKYFKKYDDELSKDTVIIAYCDGKDCSAATRIIFKLIARGYTNVSTISGGFDAWNEEN